MSAPVITVSVESPVRGTTATEQTTIADLRVTVGKLLVNAMPLPCVLGTRLVADDGTPFELSVELRDIALIGLHAEQVIRAAESKVAELTGVSP